MMTILHTKWISTVASIWIQSSCGGSYAFGIYSSALKKSKGYDQSTLDTISVFKDIGANAGILSGILYSASSRRNNCGPWLVHLIGAMQCFIGYFLIWSSVVGLFKFPLEAICFFMWLAAHAQTFFNTANVVTGVHNYGHYGGTIVGILKGFLGLSGAILVQFYETVCKGHPSTFIMLLAITPTIITLLLMGFVKNYDSSSKYDKKHLNELSFVALLIATYLMAIIVLRSLFTLSSLARISAFAVLLILFILPLAIAARAENEESERVTRALLEEKWLASESKTEEPLHCDVELFQAIGLREALLCLNFWLLFVATFCALGSGLATINNMNQVGESLGYSVSQRNSLVSLWSIWNFLGRFGAGFVSDFFLHRASRARPLFMAIALFSMTIGHVLIALGFSKNLYLGNFLVGISYGSHWSLMPTIASEIFGLDHMGTIFNTIAVASPLGSYIFSVKIIGRNYDRAAAGDRTCFGTRCFSFSFFALASFAFSGALVSLVLLYRTRRLYNSIATRHLQRV